MRLTQEEDKIIDDYVQMNGTTRSKLLRKIIREFINEKPDLLDHELEEFKNATRQVMAIGRNLNQITRAVNAGKVPKSLHNECYYQALLERLDSLEATLKDYVNLTKHRSVTQSE